MPSAGRQDWVNRLSKSLRAHESDRQAARETLPRYEILGELGRGGMGVVYRAWDPQLGREVALKVLAESAGVTPEARARFLREAQVASQLSHPNIVSVYDTGEWMGQAYLALQLIDGITLDKAKLDLPGNLRALRDVARALHHAHGLGVVHRDVKPSNVMLDSQGRAYVMDFGIARRLDVPAKLTLTGVIMGTPCYMSPEQVHGEAADARSDVYSLGATMYDLLSGRPPFQEDDIMATLKAVSDREPPRPRLYDPSLPTAVENIILKAIEKEPDHRYPTAGDLADDLQRYLDGEPILARPAPLRFKIKRAFKRHRGSLITAAVALFVLLAAWFFLPGVDPKLRRFDRLIQQAKIVEAKSVCHQLEPDYFADPRYQESVTALKLQIKLELERRSERLDRWLEKPELGKAEKALESMRLLPMEDTHPVLDKAERLFSGAKAAFGKVERLDGRVEKELQEGAFEKARGSLEMLEAVRVPGGAVPFGRQREMVDRRRDALIGLLEARIGSDFSSGALRCLSRVDQAAYERIRKSLSPAASLAWRIYDENPSLAELKEIVGRIEALNSATPCPKELRFSLDRYGSQIREEWAALEPAELEKESRAHGAAAFEANSASRLNVLRDAIGESLGEAQPVRVRLAAELSAVLDLLAGEASIRTFYREKLQAAERQLAALKAATYAPSYARKAGDLLGKLTTLLRRERGKRLKDEITRECLEENLDGAEKGILPLLKVGLAPEDPLITSALAEVKNLRDRMLARFETELDDLQQTGKAGRVDEFTSRFDSLLGRTYRWVPDRNARIAEKAGVLAETLVERGDERQAGEWLDKGLALDDKNAALWDRRGRVYRNTGSWSEAIDAWKRSITLLATANRADELRRKVVLCRRVGDFDPGIAAAERLASLNGLSPKAQADAHLLLGQLRYLRSEVRKEESGKAAALDSLETADLKDPGNGKILYWIGTVRYETRSKGDEGLLVCLRIFERARQAGYRAPHLDYQIARIIVSLKAPSSSKDSKRAERLMTQLLNGGPALDDEGYVAALYELERRGVDAARERFRRDCFVVRARARFHIARPSAEAVPLPAALRPCFQDCQAALGIDPKASTARIYRGFVRYYWGDLEDALEDFERVREESPYKSERETAAAWAEICRDRLNQPKDR